MPGSGGCSFLDLYTPHGDMCVDPIPWWRERDSAPLEKSWEALQHPSSRRASNPEHKTIYVHFRDLMQYSQITDLYPKYFRLRVINEDRTDASSPTREAARATAALSNSLPSPRYQTSAAAAMLANQNNMVVGVAKNGERKGGW